MFLPSDPRFDEILELAEHATGEGLLDRQRPRWRVLHLIRTASALLALTANACALLLAR